MSNIFVFRQPPHGVISEYFGGGGKGGQTVQSTQIPPEVLARYNAVNSKAEEVAQTPFQQYNGEFVAGLNPTQNAGVQATSDYSQSAQPYYGAGAGLTLGASQGVGPVSQGQIGYYQNPYTQSVVNSTEAALNQQFGQQNAQLQSQAIKGGAFGGDRSNLAQAQLAGQQGLALSQSISPLYQQSYTQALNEANLQQQNQQANLARQMQGGAQLGNLGAGAQGAALAGAQAQIAAGTLGQQTQQAQDTALYQQFLQERGYPFQTTQFLANIAEGTGALSGNTTSSQQSGGYFSSDERLKKNIEHVGKLNDGQNIYRYQYKDDPHGDTHIGVLGQEALAKKKPGVGLDPAGYLAVNYHDVTDDAAHEGKGLIPNSMGGAVHESGNFARGGYAEGGMSWADILAAHKAGLPGQEKQQTPGLGIPTQSSAPKTLQTAPLLQRKQEGNPLTEAANAGKNIVGAKKAFDEMKSLHPIDAAKNFFNGTGTGDKSTMRAPTEGTPGSSSPAAATGAPGKQAGLNPSEARPSWMPDEHGNVSAATSGEAHPINVTSAGQAPLEQIQSGGAPSGTTPATEHVADASSINDVADSSSNLGDFASMSSELGDLADFAKRGGRINPFCYGGVVPRTKRAPGGTVNPYSTSEDPNKIMDDVDKEGEQSTDALKNEQSSMNPKVSGGGGGGGGSPLSAIGPLLSIASFFNAGGSVSPFAYGGLVPREHHDGSEGNIVGDDGTTVVEQPPIGEDVVNAAPGLKVSDLEAAKAEAEKPTGLNTNVMNLTPDKDQQPKYKVEPIKFEDLPAHQQTLLNSIAAPESAGRWDVRYGGVGSSGKTFDINGPHPAIPERTADGRLSTAAGRYMFTKPTWDGVTGGAPMTEGYQNAATVKLAQQEYKSQTGRDLDEDLQKNGMTPEIAKALSGQWTGLKNYTGKTAPVPDSSVPSASSLISKASDIVRGKSGPGEYDNKPASMASMGDIVREYAPAGMPTSENFWVPALGFLGAMLSSPSPKFLGALGSGLVGGASGYMELRRSQQEDVKNILEVAKSNYKLTPGENGNPQIVDRFGQILSPQEAQMNIAKMFIQKGLDPTVAGVAPEITAAARRQMSGKQDAGPTNLPPRVNAPAPVEEGAASAQTGTESQPPIGSPKGAPIQPAQPGQPVKPEPETPPTIEDQLNWGKSQWMDFVQRPENRSTYGLDKLPEIDAEIQQRQQKAAVLMKGAQSLQDPAPALKQAELETQMARDAYAKRQALVEAAVATPAAKSTSYQADQQNQVLAFQKKAQERNDPVNYQSDLSKMKQAAQVLSQIPDSGKPAEQLQTMRQWLVQLGIPTDQAQVADFATAQKLAAGTISGIINAQDLNRAPAAGSALAGQQVAGPTQPAGTNFQIIARNIAERQFAKERDDAYLYGKDEKGRPYFGTRVDKFNNDWQKAHKDHLDELIAQTMNSPEMPASPNISTKEWDNLEREWGPKGFDRAAKVADTVARASAGKPWAASAPSAPSAGTAGPKNIPWTFANPEQSAGVPITTLQ